VSLVYSEKIQCELVGLSVSQSDLCR